MTGSTAAALLAATIVQCCARSGLHGAKDDTSATSGRSDRRLRLPAVLSSHAVMQHSVPVPIWGWAPAGEVVSVTLTGSSHGRSAKTVVASRNGTFAVALPPQPAGLAPTEITIKAASDVMVLSDIVFGSTVLCAGQSNMGLGVDAMENARAELAQASNHTSLRLLNVANTQAGCNASHPLQDVTIDRPWSTPAVISPANFSAACYFLGVEMTKRRPYHPVGLITAAWGGVGIEVFMTVAALEECGDCGNNRGGCELASRRVSRDPGLAYLARRRASPTSPTCGIPRTPGTLWNAMIAPLTPLRLSAFYWYHALQAKPTPFIVVQLAPWPEQESGILSKMRYAQDTALQSLPATGMVVAADLGDPAGIFHPIHTPYKAELGRRAALAADHLVFGNLTVPREGPRVVNVTYDLWQPSWGEEWHHGTPYDPMFINTQTACGFRGDPGGSGPWLCAGLRVTFDRDVVLRSESYSRGAHGAAFELLNDVYAENERAADRGRLNESACPVELWPNCSRCPCKQPLALAKPLATGAYSGDSSAVFRTLQLNITFVSGKPEVLRYGHGDYPTLVLYCAVDGRPVPPFNVSIPMPS